MTARNPLTSAPPMAVEQALTQLGASLRTARLRRGLTAQALGARIGVSRQTVAEAEKGNPTTAVAVYAGLLWSLGLIEQLGEVAAPERDAEGQALARRREPKRARARRDLDDDF